MNKTYNNNTTQYYFETRVDFKDKIKNVFFFP